VAWADAPTRLPATWLEMIRAKGMASGLPDHGRLEQCVAGRKLRSFQGIGASEASLERASTTV
jgi:hypothetical protein